METRNDIGKLNQANIPVVLGEFSCGWFGRHQPPTVEDGKITIRVGKGYESNKHLHGQNVYVLEAGDHVALIEMRKYGDLYGSGMWHYLIGVDGAPFVSQVASTINDLETALESLKPAAVKTAEDAGIEVKRQGDWYFVLAGRTPRGDVQHNQPLDDDHVAADIIVLKTVTYVRGTITHAEHSTITLNDWHKAYRNNAIRTGYLAGGGNVD